MRAANVRSLIITKMGQFLIGEELELDYSEFLRLVKEALGRYSFYRPRVVRESLTIPHVFSVEPYPLWIAGVEFVGMRHPPYDWYYDDERHYIYCEINGMVSGGGLVRAEVAYPYTLVYASDGSDPYWDIPYINESDHELLFQLILGMTLVSLGTSRDSFTLNDLPISNNASELRSTGETIISETMQKLSTTNQKMATAWSIH